DPSEVQNFLQASQNLLTPGLHPASEKIRLGNLLLLKFEVVPGFELYRVTGGRSFYRIATETPSLPSEQIQSLKEAKRTVVYERQQPLNATWDALDPDAVEALTSKTHDDREAPQILAQTYHLLDNSRGCPMTTMAGLLHFGRDNRLWHPRFGIDFVKLDDYETMYG